MIPNASGGAIEDLIITAAIGSRTAALGVIPFLKDFEETDGITNNRPGVVLRNAPRCPPLPEGGGLGKELALSHGELPGDCRPH